MAFEEIAAGGAGDVVPEIGSLQQKNETKVPQVHVHEAGRLPDGLEMAGLAISTTLEGMEGGVPEG